MVPLPHLGKVSPLPGKPVRACYPSSKTIFWRHRQQRTSWVYSAGMATRSQRKIANPGTGPHQGPGAPGSQDSQGTLGQDPRAPKGFVEGVPGPHKYPGRSWGPEGP